MRLVDLFINVAIKGHTRRCVRADVAYLDLNKQNAKVVPLVVVLGWIGSVALRLSPAQTGTGTRGQGEKKVHDFMY